MRMRFSLKTLFVVTTILALVIGAYFDIANFKRDAWWKWFWRYKGVHYFVIGMMLWSAAGFLDLKFYKKVRAE